MPTTDPTLDLPVTTKHVQTLLYEYWIGLNQWIETNHFIVWKRPLSKQVDVHSAIYSNDSEYSVVSESTVCVQYSWRMYWMCETDTLLHHNVDLLRCLFRLIISFYYFLFLIFSLYPSLPHLSFSLSISLVFNFKNCLVRPYTFALTVASNFFSAEILRWKYLYHNLYLGWLVPSLSSGV